MSTLDDALVDGRLHIDGRPVVDWERDATTGRVELFLASDWDAAEIGDTE